ncbi:hypothetical protein Vretimale_207 [Volvox reticuliferus]|uniref:Rubisco LSMT substrate-binding domain-containing protein n=1 Tax=Volvox reticuliferus TaxID=1737510 RepID=A0A8J4FLH6_9CHLO|nr:hypothetical protein Vretifemale_8336 [Volvox reticuliferus]GIL93842.1 hypothetical protein Vretimale_207 [Volvox reticuliferus]
MFNIACGHLGLTHISLKLDVTSLAERGVRYTFSHPKTATQNVNILGKHKYRCKQSIGTCRVPQCGALWPSRAAPAAGAAFTAPPDDASLEILDMRAAHLKAWILVHSKGILPTQLTPVQRSDGSYSLVACEPVRRGQILVRVPRHLLLSAETARACHICGRTIHEAALNDWQSLILHLLCERALGPISQWWPYLNTLPQDMSFHPLLWGPERLAWLTGSPMLATLRQRQAQVVMDTEALMVAGANDMPFAAEYRQKMGEYLVDQRSVAWAAAILLSRSFSLDLSEEESLEGDMGYFGTWTSHAADVLALVPWADCLAHSSAAGPESCARYQYELGVVTLSAHRDYEVGEPVFDSHGPHLSPVDIFLDYGMEEQPPQLQPLRPGEGSTASAVADLRRSDLSAAAERGAAGAGEGIPKVVVEGGSGVGWWQHHRFDADPAEVAPPRSSRNASLLAALAAVQGEGCHLALGEKGPDSASLTYLRAALASSTELVRAGWRVKASERDVELACRAMGSLAQPSSAATERAVLKALAEYVAAALERFPSSLEQDLARLEGREGYEKVTGPERLAVVALASQKRALRGTAQTVATWQAKLAAGCPLEELYRDDEDGEWAEEDEEGEEGEGDEHL